MITVKKVYARTMTPFDGGLSPLTDKTRGTPLFGNTPLIQDLLNGEPQGPNDIKGRGAWSSEPDDQHNYKEEGSEYRLDESLRKLDNERAVGRAKAQRWVAEMEDGTQYEFPSKGVAQFQLRVIGKPYKRLFMRSAADTTLVSRIIDGCVGVVSKPSSGNGGVGAAFCVSEGKFVTCAHVIREYDIATERDKAPFLDNSTIIEVSRGDIKVVAKVLGVDLEKDVAVLQADLPSEVLEIASSRNRKAGEDVIVVGSPKGYENNVSEGIIGGLERVVFTHDGAALHIFTDAKILPGNSGGPMVAVSDGKVIGLVEIVVGDDVPYGLNAAVASEYVVDAVKGMGIGFLK